MKRCMRFGWQGGYLLLVRPPDMPVASSVFGIDAASHSHECPELVHSKRRELFLAIFDFLPNQLLFLFAELDHIENVLHEEIA